MYVHTFGAYFGVAVSYVLTDMDKVKKFKKLETGDYNSNLIAFVGTLFLFCYWPSFNGVFAVGNS